MSNYGIGKERGDESSEYHNLFPCEGITNALYTSSLLKRIIALVKTTFVQVGASGNFQKVNRA